jgi:hypothetical protein
MFNWFERSEIGLNYGEMMSVLMKRGIGSDKWSLHLSEQGCNIKCLKYVQSSINEIINW